MLHVIPQILIHHVNYSIPNDRMLFQALNLSLSAKKIGLIGRNGTGKSTLLKLIMGEVLPDAGSIHVTGELSYCPQQFDEPGETCIAHVLGVKTKLDALSRIEAGSTHEEDFKLVDDDWLIAERTHQQLIEFGLQHIALTSTLDMLSNGEKTRLYLAKAFLTHPDFIILDEPTNNLDSASRAYLYTAIAKWKKGLIVVSHDRALLNLMDEIIELTTLGATIYGGNYDHYITQKELHLQANLRELSDAKKALTSSKISIQGSREKREQKKSRGRKLRLTGKTDKMSANSKKGRSEKTQSRLATQSEMLLQNAKEKLQEAKSKIECIENINVDLPKTFVPNGKVIVEINNLSFSYTEHSSPIINQFNMKIMGPERIGLMGKNGCGKTTLIKLIMQSLTPSSGSIKLGVDQISYLDQTTKILHEQSSILDNFLRLNPSANQMDAQHALAKFLFRNVNANKLVKNLSGGEKLRAALACTLMADIPPQLLILDEPTNHLDINSIASIESALSCYQGTMIIITHDMTFLKNINVTRCIYAPFHAL